MSFNFTPITLEKQARYRSFLAQCPQVASDYSFVNLWGWSDEYGLQWSFNDGLVWIMQTRPADVLWAPVGPWSDVAWNAVQPMIAGTGFDMIRVPEILAELLKAQWQGGLALAEDRGQWDYIYSVAELSALKGNRFHKKKNLVNQFKRKYDYTYLPFKNALVNAALDLQENWCTWRDCEAEAVLSAENRVIERVLHNWDRLGSLVGGVIKVGDELTAYTVAEALTPDSLVIHFEKGDPQYKGVYQAINQMFLTAAGGDFSMVNREQDLGDPGLRKAKESYNPVDYLRKYHLRLG